MQILKYFTHEEIDIFSFVGFHSDTKATDDLLAGKPFTHGVSTSIKLRVAIAHAPIGPEATHYCRGVKELMIPSFDVLLLGDIHDGWEPHTCLTGCVIANPGSLTRLNVKDIKREPKIAVIWEDGSIQYEVVPHEPASKVFDMSGLEEKKLDLGRGFLAAIAARNKAEDMDPIAYIEKIGIAANYSDKAIKLLQNEIKI